MSEETKEKLCTDCKEKPGKHHWDNGLYCGDDMCGECFEKMVQKCRSQSW